MAITVGSCFVYWKKIPNSFIKKKNNHDVKYVLNQNSVIVGLPPHDLFLLKEFYYKSVLKPQKYQHNKVIHYAVNVTVD